MEKFGFVNYPFEYWHYSLGDVCAAYQAGPKKAVYGPVAFDGGRTILIDKTQARQAFKV